MNEEKKKIFKLSYIFITLAVVFAIFSIFYSKSNAAELTPYFNYTINNVRINPDYDLYGGYTYADSTGTSYELNLNPEYIYAFNRVTIEASDILYQFYMYYLDPANPDEIHLVSSVDNNADEFPLFWYTVQYAGKGSTVGHYPVYEYNSLTKEFELSGSEDVQNYMRFSYTEIDIISGINSLIYDQTYDTNILIFDSNYDSMKQYLLTGAYNKDDLFEDVVDYENLTVDDDMPVPEKLTYNRVDLSDNTLMSVSPNVYDYIKWTNTSDEYPIQIDCTVYALRYDKKKLIEEYSIDWYTWKITEEYTDSFTKNLGTTKADLDDDEWLNAHRNEVLHYLAGKLGSITSSDTYAFGYRLRYIDLDNGSAGPWAYLIPGIDYNAYDAYVQYSDGYMHLFGDSTGSFESFDPKDTTLEGATATIDKKDEAKEDLKNDGYIIVGDDMDTSDAVSWLNAVISFIKSTPSLVKSVMSFLPSTILYGLYAIIFLGVIAAAWAIVKALI